MLVKKTMYRPFRSAFFTTRNSSNFATLIEHNRCCLHAALKGAMRHREFYEESALLVLAANCRDCNLIEHHFLFSFLCHAKIGTHFLFFARFTVRLERLSKATRGSCFFVRGIVRFGLYLFALFDVGILHRAPSSSIV